jgi:AcrR family transcriptional regulator
MITIYERREETAMKNGTTDRRVKYTKQALRDSLIALLQKKPIEKVSIKEICEAADINRSTFYAHYTDQYDLLSQIERELLRDLNAYLDSYNFKELEAESFQTMNHIFEYIVENAELCGIILGENGDLAFQKEIMTIVQRQCMREWRGKNAVDEGLLEYAMIFIVNGSIGVVQKWLQTDMRASTREMAEFVLSFSYRGLAALLP